MTSYANSHHLGEITIGLQFNEGRARSMLECKNKAVTFVNYAREEVKKVEFSKLYQCTYSRVSKNFLGFR
jgi:hypothetical protein